MVAQAIKFVGGDENVGKAVAGDAVLMQFVKDQIAENARPADPAERAVDPAEGDNLIRQYFGEKATSRDVLVVSSLRDLAGRYYHNQEYDKAAEVFFAARQRIPVNCYGYWPLTSDIALSLANAGRFDEAILILLENHFHPDALNKAHPASPAVDSPVNGYMTQILVTMRRTNIPSGPHFHFDKMTFLLSSLPPDRGLRQIRDEIQDSLLYVTYMVERPLLDVEGDDWFAAVSKEWTKNDMSNRVPLEKIRAYRDRFKDRLATYDRALLSALLGDYEEAAVLAAGEREPRRQVDSLNLLRKVLILATGDPRTLYADGERLNDLPWSRDTKVAIVRRLRRDPESNTLARRVTHQMVDFAFGTTTPEQIRRTINSLKTELKAEEFVERLVTLYLRQTGSSREAVSMALLREAGVGDGAGRRTPAEVVNVMREWGKSEHPHAAVFHHLAMEYALREGLFDEVVKISEGLNDASRDDRTQLVLALALVQKERETEALGVLTALLEKWPDGPSAERALFLRGYLEFMNGNEAAAAVSFKGVVERWPNGEFARRAGPILERIGGAAATPAPAAAVEKVEPDAPAPATSKPPRADDEF